MTPPHEVSFKNRHLWDCNEELDAWRDVGQRLWPFVRFFGLCGAHLDATQAIADLAICLDLDFEAVNTAHADEARQQTAKQCAQWLIDHRFNGRKVRRSDMERLADEMRGDFGGAE